MDNNFNGGNNQNTEDNNNSGYTPQPNQTQKSQGINGFEIAALCMGALTVQLCCLSEVLSICCGLLAIISAFLGRQQVVKNGVTRKKFGGMSMVGIILAVLGILLSIYVLYEKARGTFYYVE